MPPELVNVDGFIAPLNVFEVEIFSGDKRRDFIVARNFHARAVHPTFVLVDKGERLARVIDQFRKHGVFKNQIGLQKQRVFLAKIIPRQKQRVNIIRLVVNRVVDVNKRRLNSERRDKVD